MLIIEDNKAEVEALKKVVERVAPEADIAATDNIGKALEYAVKNTFSLFIVDIVLVPKKITDTSGIDFVEAIRNMPQYKFVPVIFVSSLEDPRMHAYQDLHCYSYIQKPLFYSEVEPVVKEALEFTRSLGDDKPLRLKQDNVLYVIPKQDIIYACSKAYKMTIVTRKETFGFYYLTCKELMQKLDSLDFIQCSRFTIVNCRQISSIDKSNGIIQFRDCKDYVKIGGLYKKELIKRMNGDS